MSRFAAVVDQLADRGYALRRAWPRSFDHLHLDLQPLDPAGAAAGRPVAGQWFADVDRARVTAEETAGATQGGPFVWQPAGADRKLTSLADLLADPGSELVGHRPERRAVLRVRDRPRDAHQDEPRDAHQDEPRDAHQDEPRDAHQDGHSGAGALTYAKVVPRRRWAGTVEVTERAARLPLRTPVLLGGDEKRGTVVTAALPGVPLHDLLGTDRALAACEATGRSLAALHTLPVPDDLPEHDLEAERAVTTHWEGLAAAFGASTDTVPLVPRTSAETTDPAGRRPRVVLHRDFHDKQVLVDEAGEIGVLDFDLMAVGDPALDLANLLVHLDLRAGQGATTDPSALRAAVLRGYGPAPEVMDAVGAYEALAGRRIAAVYAFRSTSYVT